MNQIQILQFLVNTHEIAPSALSDISILFVQKTFNFNFIACVTV